MPSVLRAVLVSAAFLVSGCSWMGGQATPVGLLLLPPQSGPESYLLKQAITLDTGQQSAQFIVASRFDHQRARLAALMPSGMQLASLEYDGEALQQEVFVPVDLPGEQILATIQFSIWPEASVRQIYAPQTGWRVDIQPERRQLWYQETLILDVVHVGNRTNVTNYPQGYRVSIQTLEKKGQGT